MRRNGPRFDQLHSQHPHIFLSLNLSATCLLHVFPMDDPGVVDSSVQGDKEHAKRPPLGFPSTRILNTHLVKRVHTFRPVVVLNDGWLCLRSILLITPPVITKIVRKHYPRVGNTWRVQHPVSLTPGTRYPNVGLQHEGVEIAK